LLCKLIKRSAMNTFRTLILIVVSTIQISCMFSNISWDSLQSTKLVGKFCNEVKHVNFFKKSESGRDLRLTKNDDLQVINSTICRKEAPLKSAVKPEISSNKSNDLPVAKTLENNQQPIKNISGISQISFNATVSAELF